MLKVIETRFTRETGSTPYTFWPLGIQHNWMHNSQRFEIGYQLLADYYLLAPSWNDSEYGVVLQGDGSPMYKFVMPTKVSSEWRQIRFNYNGTWFILEIRIVLIQDDTQKEKLF